MCDSVRLKTRGRGEVAQDEAGEERRADHRPSDAKFRSVDLSQGLRDPLVHQSVWGRSLL